MYQFKIIKKSAEMNEKSFCCVLQAREENVAAQHSFCGILQECQQTSRRFWQRMVRISHKKILPHKAPMVRQRVFLKHPSSPRSLKDLPYPKESRAKGAL